MIGIRCTCLMRRTRDQLVENFRLDLHNYRRMEFAALEAPTTTHRGQLGGSVHMAGTSINNDLKALIDTFIGFQGLPASGK